MTRIAFPRTEPLFDFFVAFFSLFCIDTFLSGCLSTAHTVSNSPYFNTNCKFCKDILSKREPHAVRIAYFSSTTVAPVPPSEISANANDSTER